METREKKQRGEKENPEREGKLLRGLSRHSFSFAFFYHLNLSSKVLLPSFWFFQRFLFLLLFFYQFLVHFFFSNLDKKEQ